MDNTNNVSTIKYKMEDTVHLDYLYNKVNNHKYKYIVIYIIIIIMGILILYCNCKGYFKYIIEKLEIIKLRNLRKSSKDLTSTLEEGGIV